MCFACIYFTLLGFWIIFVLGFELISDVKTNLN